jgi:hypothetical protein
MLEWTGYPRWPAKQVVLAVSRKLSWDPQPENLHITSLYGLGLSQLRDWISRGLSLERVSQGTRRE